MKQSPFGTPKRCVVIEIQETKMRGKCQPAENQAYQDHTKPVNFNVEMDKITPQKSLSL